MQFDFALEKKAAATATTTTTIWTKEENLNSRNIMTRMTDRQILHTHAVCVCVCMNKSRMKSMAMITQANMMPIPVDR